MLIEESGLCYKRALLNRGMKTVEDVIAEVGKPVSASLRGVSYRKLVDRMISCGYIERRSGRVLEASHDVRKDMVYLSPFAFESNRKRGEKARGKFLSWLESVGVDSSYMCVALLYEVGKLQESIMYCLEEGMLGEVGRFRERLDRLCLYLSYIKRKDPLRYKMVGFIFTGVSEVQMRNYTGIEEPQKYLKGIAEEVGGVVGIYETQENIDKCQLPMPRVDLGGLGLSMALLYRLGELEVRNSEELYLLYRMGVLENRWLLGEELYRELVEKCEFLRQ